MVSLCLSALRVDRRGRGGGTKVSYTSPTFAIATVLLLVQQQGRAGSWQPLALHSRSAAARWFANQSRPTLSRAGRAMALAFATASLASCLPPYHETRAMF